MFRRNYNIKINLPGGFVAAGDLYAIVEAAEAAQAGELSFGARQQLFCKVADKQGPEFLQALERAGIFYEVNEERYPNIMSSYVSEGVFRKADWVSEGLYKDILDGFDFRPALKINLVEANQTFVPFFTGNLNFISSSLNNYWWLYIRFPRTTQLYRWKDLVYSQDIPRISHLIEQQILGHKDSYFDQPLVDGERLYQEIWAIGQFMTQPSPKELQLPTFRLPYYEGFNKYGDKNWLGIYRREELFPLAFLKDVCLLCLQTRIGQLYTTPWKSLIIKGIEEKDRHLWDYILGKYRINVRHASNELNWQVEDLCEEGLVLKRYLVRHFDNEDIRTYGVCFSIRTRSATGLFGSVIIRRQEGSRPRQRKVLDRYDILYTPDFNANSKDHIVFREGLEKENLGVYLVALCKYYYESAKDPIPHLGRRGIAGGKADPGAPSSVFQCRHCLTLYDEQYGDPEAGIPAGRSFGDIDADYSCPVCGGPKEDFSAVEKSGVVH